MVGLEQEQRLASMELDLGRAMHCFLSDTFVPWAASCQEISGETRAGWLVCNDGEGFALSEPLLDFVRAGAADGDRWRSTVLVVDRAKSTAADVAMEVLAVDERSRCPRRVLFDTL
ncbi:unnamed protein product [Polarella glacialis]|nr:unnamed protein product [Polarella glacialis]